MRFPHVVFIYGTISESIATVYSLGFLFLTLEDVAQLEAAYELENVIL